MTSAARIGAASQNGHCRKKRQVEAGADQSRMGEVLVSLNALKNHPIDFDDTAARQLIDCIKVVSKTELLVIFKGGIEKTVTMEN